MAEDWKSVNSENGVVNLKKKKKKKRKEKR